MIIPSLSDLSCFFLRRLSRSQHCMQCSGSAGACSRTCPTVRFDLSKIVWPPGEHRKGKTQNSRRGVNKRGWKPWTIKISDFRSYKPPCSSGIVHCQPCLIKPEGSRSFRDKQIHQWSSTFQLSAIDCWLQETSTDLVEDLVGEPPSERFVNWDDELANIWKKKGSKPPTRDNLPSMLKIGIVFLSSKKKNVLSC